MTRQTRRVFTGAGLLAALLAPWKMLRADESKAQAPELTLKELSDQLSKLQKQYEKLSHDLNKHAVLDPPAGSIVAYSGVWPPINPANGQPRTEAEMGWALCDGRPFTHPTLEKAKSSLESELGKLLGTSNEPATNLPDLRGYFLRGIDGWYGAPNMFRDKDGVRKPLSTQAGATGLPQNRFKSDAKGTHHHRIPTSAGGNLNSGRNEVGWGKFDRWDYIDSPPTEDSGEHTHEIVGGGDAETRPINVAVHYIVKFRSAPSE